MEYVVVGVSSRAIAINRLAPRPDGRFVVIHPDVPPQERHHAKSYTWANDIDEAVHFVRKGDQARMVNVENKQSEDIIINENIKIWEFP